MFLCRPGLSCGGGGADWLNPAVSASGASCHLLEVSPPAGPPPEVGHPHFMGAACHTVWTGTHDRTAALTRS